MKVFRAKSVEEWERDHPEPGKVEAFTPEPVVRVEREADMRWGRSVTVWCGLLVVAILCVGGYAWQQDKQQKQATEFEQARLAAVGAVRQAWMQPAPTLRRGPTKHGPKGQIMATWFATGAGDSSYNGTYVESGTYNGYPAYTNGSRWLWCMGGGTQWILSPTKGDESTAPYSSLTGTLPETWTVTGNGTAPAPTLSEQVADPFNWIVDSNSFYKFPAAPCRATLAGTEYIITAAVNAQIENVFSVFDVTALDWGLALRFANESGYATFSDPYHTAAIFDGGDGSHIWTFSGILDWNGPKGIFESYAVTPGVSAQFVEAVTVPFPSMNITNLVQMADGSLRFISVGNTTTICSYTLGQSSVGTVATYATGAELPSGYYPLQYQSTEQEDQNLHLHGTQLYWTRRCCQHPNGGGYNRFVKYAVDDAGCSQLDDLMGFYNSIYNSLEGMTQAWGNIGGEEWAELGTDATYRRAMRWAIGNAGVAARSIADDGAIRCWFVDGTPSFLVGYAWVESSVYPFVFPINLDLGAVPSAIADTTAYTPMVVDVDVELTGLEGVGTGEGDVTLQIIPPVEPVAEGTAGGEGSAVLTVSPPVELTAEGEAGGEGGTLTLRAGPSEIEEASGTAGGTGAARLVSDTTPTPPDGPGAVADLVLTPGTWPGATRRVALPAYFERSLNRRYGGTLGTSRPTWRTPVDAVNPLAEYVDFWSWCAEQPGETDRLVNATGEAGTHGVLVDIADDYAVIVSGGAGAGVYGVQEYVAEEYVSADGLYTMLRDFNGHWKIVLTATSQIVQQGVNNIYDAPWLAVWPAGLTVAAGEEYSRWRNGGLRAIPDRQFGDSHHALCALGWPDACTFLWDFTSTMRSGIDVLSQPGMMLAINSNVSDIERPYLSWSASLTGISFSIRTVSGSIGTAYRGTVSLPFGGRYRVVIATNRTADTVEATVNAVPVTMQLTAGSSIGDTFKVPPISDGYLWGWGGRPDAGTNGAVGLLHEFGFLSGYAATAEDVRQNQGLLFPYGFAASLGGQMTDRPA